MFTILNISDVEQKNILSFSCGKSKDCKRLDKFLKERALQEQNELLSTTNVLCDGNKIVAYYTLCSASLKIDPKNIDVSVNYPQYPALRIARLAVGMHYQMKGLGQRIMKAIIGLAYKLNESLGLRFIVLEPKRDVVSWYKDKLSFKIFYEEDDDVFLYYDLLG